MKTISLDDDAYDALRGLKVAPGDSFSDVVKRHFGHGAKLEESAGGWADVREAEVKALRRETVDAFGTTAE